MSTRNRGALVFLYWVAVAVTASGCRVPAGMTWAPDGGKGAYHVDGRAIVIDREGQVLADLGASVAGYCWSGDSTQLYVATLEADEGAVPLTEVRGDWLVHTSPTPRATPGLSMLDGPAPAAPSATAPATATVDGKGREPLKYHRLTVSARRDGKTTPLFRVRTPCEEARLLPSPDGAWLVVGTSLGNLTLPGLPMPGLAMPDLYAFSLRSGQLFAVAPWCASACFTGPNRLAFARCAGVSDLAMGLYAILFEATLAEDQKPAPDGLPNTRALLELMPPWTGPVQPLGEDLLLTAARREFPHPLHDGQLDESPQYQLYRWSRNTGRLDVVSENVGPWFLLSPAGRRVLFYAPVVQEKGERTRPALAVVNLDGTGRWNLRAREVPVDDEHFALGAMEPAWRDEDHIVLAGPSADAPPPATGDKNRTRYDVTLYRLGLEGRLDRVRTLSSGWNPTTRPYMEGFWLTPRPSTGPSTLPARE
jgi:hypothetical protein